MIFMDGPDLGIIWSVELSSYRSTFNPPFLVSPKSEWVTFFSLFSSLSPISQSRSRIWFHLSDHNLVITPLVAPFPHFPWRCIYFNSDSIATTLGFWNPKMPQSIKKDKTRGHGRGTNHFSKLVFRLVRANRMDLMTHPTTSFRKVPFSLFESGVLKELLGAKTFLSQHIPRVVKRVARLPRISSIMKSKKVFVFQRNSLLISGLEVIHHNEIVDESGRFKLAAKGVRSSSEQHEYACEASISGRSKENLVKGNERWPSHSLIMIIFVIINNNNNRNHRDDPEASPQLDRKQRRNLFSTHQDEAVLIDFSQQTVTRPCRQVCLLSSGIHVSLWDYEQQQLSHALTKFNSKYLRPMEAFPPRDLLAHHWVASS